MTWCGRPRSGGREHDPHTRRPRRASEASTPEMCGRCYQETSTWYIACAPRNVTGEGDAPNATQTTTSIPIRGSPKPGLKVRLKRLDRSDGCSGCRSSGFESRRSTVGRTRGVVSEPAAAGPDHTPQRGRSGRGSSPCPRRRRSRHELLLRVVARVDLRDGPQLRVRAEDEVDGGGGPLRRRPVARSRPS